MEITISGKDKKRIKLVEELAIELGLSIKKSTQDETELTDAERSEELYQLMEEMAQSGAFQSIKDPVKWQKEQRKDRSLPGRQ